MTPLQILRQMLQAGATLTLSAPDGYCIVAEMADASGRPVRWQVVDSRLDQAIHRLVAGPEAAGSLQEQVVDPSGG